MLLYVMFMNYASVELPGTRRGKVVMSDDSKLQCKAINKEVIFKKDGRYLIYYRFQKAMSLTKF